MRRAARRSALRAFRAREYFLTAALTNPSLCDPWAVMMRLTSRSGAGAGRVLRHSVQRFHDVPKLHVRGRHPQREAACGTFAGAQQSLPGKLLQDLGQEVRRNVLLLRDVL